MTLAIRTLTRCIWVMVKEPEGSKSVVEKTSAINLLLAFAFATKNYLREEYSYDEAVKVNAKSESLILTIFLKK